MRTRKHLTIHMECSFIYEDKKLTDKLILNKIEID